MVRWGHQLSGHEFEQTPGNSGGQRSLAHLVTGQQQPSQRDIQPQRALSLSPEALLSGVISWLGLN